MSSDIPPILVIGALLLVVSLIILSSFINLEDPITYPSLAALPWKLNSAHSTSIPPAPIMQAWKSPADTMGAEPAAGVALEDQCEYRFLFNFRAVHKVPGR